MSGVKSQPAYIPLQAVLTARSHVLIGEKSGVGPLLRVLDALRGSAAPRHVLWLGEVPEALAGQGDLHPYEDSRALAEGLRECLAASVMGVRLYLAGRESFVWEAARAAIEAGLREDEIQREACEVISRRVFCVHCRQVLEHVVGTPVKCTGCGMVLGVRDHFSPALTAYLGVCDKPSDPWGASKGLGSL